MAILGKIVDDHGKKTLEFCSSCGGFILFDQPDHLEPEDLVGYKRSNKKCCKCINDENKLQT